MSALNTPHSSFDWDLVYYIAGPMTGIKDFNYPAFQSAMEELEISNIKVVSPHTPFANEDPATHDKRPWQDFMKSGLKMLMRADGIILLPGWPTSKGARLELDIAMDLAYPVYFYNSNWLLTSMMRP